MSHFVSLQNSSHSQIGGFNITGSKSKKKTIVDPLQNSSEKNLRYSRQRGHYRDDCIIEVHVST
jgi:hypothetical protein